MKNLYLQIKHKTFSKNDTGEMPNLELPANDKNLNYVLKALNIKAFLLD